ncbi:hypothetical protein [Shewanella colwelliana]|uniref:hypothetical protein n=1 Tax=Shewanella colwelliana TaxID=23 RepID=UPI0022B0204E|nr:hypothetical protein [Shewanella colwelliana]MCZ4337795.1 hypothetical protein [Shewanella colwelliana]
MIKNLLGENTLANSNDLISGDDNSFHHNKFTTAVISEINKLADSNISNDELIDMLRVEPSAVLNIVVQSIKSDEYRAEMQAKVNDQEYMAEATAIAETTPTMKGIH